MTCKIRVARESDAADISAVILRALRESNARDYSPEIITRVEPSFSPSAVLELMGKRVVFVAIIASRIVGTASLDGEVIRTVFVAPDVQGQGVGRRLMAEIELAARKGGVKVLTVPSSLTAEAFYARLGFRTVRDSYHGEERTIIMQRALT
ncbi:GNAT family N-acetyltransferase [Mesorhizobium opportunistum]|uniref:GNAT family N-acetyltransferase n=2 Tax=Mesorhizobium opportunistum TaxID=593909 RepID=A0ABV1YR53_9HYPH|nr:GNAT family N-acetyltransferase [Mesorhizobium sp.]TIN96864.1 MAG: GNAT family N-acetyltransferase [Mesorhizobium sp.]TJV00741.1 MAG: GNAT family N-acetyltransferase [Mesorhizobium sp.]TJV15526.1 MAG: GNAT family N-acetyltransferase [Mesorhizobium sp.]